MKLSRYDIGIKSAFLRGSREAVADGPCKFNQPRTRTRVLNAGEVEGQGLRLGPVHDEPVEPVVDPVRALFGRHRSDVLVKERHRNIERMRNEEQPSRADAVRPTFIFLNLLERQANFVTQVLL